MIKPSLCVLLTALSAFTLPACHADLPTLTVLHTFAPGGPGDLNPAHNSNLGGSHPEASLAQGRDGAWYGTTQSGGAGGTGVIFKINGDGTGFTVLHSFGPLAALFVNETNADGCWPEGALVQGKDDMLYGAASQGGPGGSGTIFKLSPDGSGFTVLHSFEPKEEMFHNSGGASPLGLTIGADQALYGAAELGGDGRGLIFRITSDGRRFRILHSFSDTEYDGSANINSDGAIPGATAIVGRGGILYGTTNVGGKGGGGVIYKMDPDGKHFTVLHNFQRKAKNNGAFPDGSLILGADGYLYGCTGQGGDADGGIAYRMNANSTDFTVLHTFTAPGSGGADGWSPSAPAFGTDGRLYGVSGGSGDTGQAMLFKFSSDGAKFFLTHSFTQKEGTSARAGMVLGRDGNLYGVSTNGGANGTGTVFRVTFPAAK